MMKIRRAPATANNWTAVTDKTKGTKWAENWKPGTPIDLDGTIHKTGERHTAIGVEIEEDDIIALSNALMRHQKTRIRELSQAVDYMETALVKIAKLVTLHRDKAPTVDALLKAVEDIADNFGASFEPSFKPVKLDWIKWKEI
jgi:hypothetical protein